MNKDQSEIKVQLEGLFPYIFEKDLIEEMAQNAQLQKICKKTVLIDVGDPINSFPILLSGSIKIVREDEDDHELLLYYLELGDTCAVTLQCCMGNTNSSIKAQAEEDTELILFPIHLMDTWMAKYSSFRRFILDNYHSRFQEMMGAIDKLAFSNLEERLYNYLREKAMLLGSSTINTTQEEIAINLNSSRVVMSRLLKKLELQGKIQRTRNSIKFLEFS